MKSILSLTKPGLPDHRYGNASAIIGRLATLSRKWQTVPTSATVRVVDIDLSGSYAVTALHEGKKLTFPADALEVDETEPLKFTAAACMKCGGWTSFGGMSQHHKTTVPVMGRLGCICH